MNAPTTVGALLLPPLPLLLLPLLLMGFAFSGFAPVAFAQDSAATPILTREAFEYPATGRRDPFAPLSTGVELGPRFDDLGLSGVIYSPQSGSVAVLVDRVTGRRYRLWEGDVIGGARLVAVRPDEVEFQVSVFGVSRRDTLRLETQGKEQGS